MAKKNKPIHPTKNAELQQTKMIRRSNAQEIRSRDYLKRPELLSLGSLARDTESLTRTNGTQGNPFIKKMEKINEYTLYSRNYHLKPI